MRNLAIFLLLIVAFFILLTDKKLGSGKSKAKGDPSQSSSQVSSDQTMESLSDEYKPQDLSKYSNIQKLNEDFDYRRSKLEYQQDEEIKEFLKNHDRYGKDQEAYEKMTKRQAKLRSEFHENRIKTLEYYQKVRTDEPVNPNLR